MSQELTKQQPRELTKLGESLLQKIERSYSSDYAAKPAPQSMEVIADNREKIPTLYQVSQLKGKTYSVALVTSCITTIISKHIHVIRGMDATMAAATAELIVQRYPNMSAADVKFFLTKGVSGEYGQILDRVDGALVLSWASQYWDQMKNLIKLRRKNEYAEIPKGEVPESIARLSEQLRIKQQEKKAKTVASDQKQSLKDWYAERGIDIDQRNKECETLKTF